MAITFIDSQSNNNAANDDITVTGYSGIQDGDLLIGCYAAYGDTTISALPVTLSGFTKLMDKFETSGTDVTLAVFYKIASSESGDYTFTGSHSGSPETSAAINVYRGVDQSTPIDVTYSEDSPGFHYTRNNNVGGSPHNNTSQPSDITTVTNGAWAVIFSWVSAGSITNFVPPTGFTERTEIIASIRNIHICTKEQVTAGSVNPDSLGLTNVSESSDASHVTFALRPETIQTVTDTLVSNQGAAQGSLSAVSWAWFDEDIGALNAPTDKGSTEITDSSGEIVLNLTGTTLTTGQTGTLVLYDSTGGKIGAYRLNID